MFNDLKRRAGEPSTWAGLAAVLEALKVFAPQYAVLIVGLQSVCGGVAVVMREAGNGRGA